MRHQCATRRSEYGRAEFRGPKQHVVRPDPVERRARRIAGYDTTHHAALDAAFVTEFTGASDAGLTTALVGSYGATRNHARRQPIVRGCAAAAPVTDYAPSGRAGDAFGNPGGRVHRCHAGG
jgi:hypothetical protein